MIRHGQLPALASKVQAAAPAPPAGAAEALPALGFDPNLIYIFGLLAVLPFLLVSTTSFVKLAVVFSLLRNALGIQQIPPNIALYGLALVLSLYIMAPAGVETWHIVREAQEEGRDFFATVPEAAVPIARFMERNTDPEHLGFFEESIERVWADELDADPVLLRHLALMPAFATTELTEAFEIGFLFYLPFIAVDLITANILLSLGMMMLSPVTISLPFKLFLFVAASGWERLIEGLVLGYAPS